MRKAVRVLTSLVMAFDEAQGAFDLERAPGWPVASERLRAALEDARALGDVGGLPCRPLWWASALAQARCWLEAGEDERRGLTPAVLQTMRALSRYSAGTLAEPVAPHGVGVR
jgi:hypothetical protein